MSGPEIDCLVIGFNEPPFAQYERELRRLGERSVIYRDLRLSMIDDGQRRLSYLDLLNEAVPAGSRPFRSGEIPNLAAVYLVSALQRRGFRADWINLFQDEHKRLEELLLLHPTLVAITTTFYVTNLPAREIVSFVRERSPETRIVIGGPLIANHVRSLDDEALRAALEDLGADFYVVESQGEDTLCRLVSALRDADLSQVPNLLYSDGSRSRVLAENNSLDELAINWRDFPRERLGPTVQTRTARSCAFRCAFCSYPTRAGALTLASLPTIQGELDAMRDQGVEQVVFIDDTFNVPLRRFKEICRMIIERRYGFSWYSYFRCSNADTEAIDLMAASGCRGVFLGIESGSPDILRAMKKAASIETYRTGIDRLHRAGILTFASFIVGFPGETQQTVDETLEFIEEAQPHYYRVQPWYLETGAPVNARRAELGISGGGFAWGHRTMDSNQAMDHIDEILSSARPSLWLPQWSFDFWILPYLFGLGVSEKGLAGFVDAANALHRVDYRMMSASRRATERNACFKRAFESARAALS